MTAHNRYIGLDLGRHRAYAVWVDPALAARPETVSLGTGHDGMLLRTDHEDRRVRTMDVVIDEAPRRPKVAERVMTELAFQLNEWLPPDQPIRVAVPVTMGAEGRSIVRRSFRNTGRLVLPDGIIGRPLAAHLGWQAWQSAIADPDAPGLTMLVDNDGGAISAAVVDPRRRRVLALQSLCREPVDDPGRLAEDFVALAEDVGRLRGLDDAWASHAGQFHRIALSGSGRDHPGLAAVVTGLFPSAAMEDDVSPGPAGLEVATGLAAVRLATGLTASWPTADLVLGELPLRLAGPTRAGEPRSFILTGGALLRLCQDGSTIPVRHLLTKAEGITIPAALGAFPTLTLEPGGVLTLRGSASRAELSVAVQWPAPGAAPSVIDVRAVDED